MRQLALTVLLLWVAPTWSQQTDFNPLANQQGATVAATRIKAITPNNDQEIGVVNRAIYVGGAGDIKVMTYGGDIVTITGVPAGALLPLSVKFIYSSGTSATYIQVWW